VIVYDKKAIGDGDGDWCLQLYCLKVLYYIHKPRLRQVTYINTILYHNVPTSLAVLRSSTLLDYLMVDIHSEYSTVQYSTVQYSTVQYSTIQYSTVH
jgi:hypothetical protein